MHKKYIYCYNRFSSSAKALSEGTGFKRIKHGGSRFLPTPNKTIINWGASDRLFPSEYGRRCRVINNPINVGIVSNKLKFFETMSIVTRGRGNPLITPEATSDKSVVREQLSGREGRVEWVARTMLSSHSGNGIVLINGDDEDIVDAPLYVKYVRKTQEYRIHVMGGEVVDVQRKARRTDVPDEEVDWKVRNHCNGFIFARNEAHEVPEDVIGKAVECVALCELDFGAVDVVWNSTHDRAYVLEVNTAPGLTGQTLEGYCRRFLDEDF